MTLAVPAVLEGFACAARYYGFAYGQTGLLFGTGFCLADNLGKFDAPDCLAAWPKEGSDFCRFWYQEPAACKALDAAGLLDGPYPEPEGRAGVLAWAEARAGWPWLGIAPEAVIAMQAEDRRQALGLA